MMDEKRKPTQFDLMLQTIAQQALAMREMADSQLALVASLQHATEPTVTLPDVEEVPGPKTFGTTRS
jgi:hypothetical protein